MSAVHFFCVLAAIATVVNGFVRFGRVDSTIEEHPDHRNLRSLVHEVKRSRVITLPQDRPNAAVGELIEFELFDGNVAIADVTNIVTREQGEVTWLGGVRMSTGDISKDLLNDGGHFALTCVKASCIANIQIYSPSKQYRITPANTQLTEDGEGYYLVSEVILDPERKTGVDMAQIMLNEKNKLALKESSYVVQTDAVTSSPSFRPTARPTARPDTDLIMDILVLYTPQAVTNNYGGR